MRTSLFTLTFAVLFCLCMGVAVAIPIAAPGDSSPAAMSYQQGLQALTRADYESADKAFSAAIKSNPQYAPAWLGRAEIAFKRNKPEEAFSFLSEASRVAPNDPHVQASLGRYFALKRDYAKAETALNRALALDPRQNTARLDLADLYATALKKPDRAIALYRDAIVQAPTHAGAHYALAMVLLDSGGQEEAQKLLVKALELEPGNPQPAVALARWNLRSGHAQEALQWIDKAIKVDPSAIPSALVRIDTLNALGRSKLAAEELARLAAKYPNNAAVQFSQAAALHREGRLSDAFTAYGKVVQLDPSNAIAWNNRAALAIELGKSPSDAVQWAKKAVALQENDPQLRDTLGWALHHSGNNAAALRELESARDLAKNDPGILYHLGVVYSSLDRKQEAAAAFTQALKVSPDFFAASDAKARLAALR